MVNIEEIINSGLLERYVLGDTTEEENIFLSELSEKSLVLKGEIEALTNALITHSELLVSDFDVTIKPMVFGVIDYKERLMAGETSSIPPTLNESSTIEDYRKWLNDCTPPNNIKEEEFFVKIIGATETLKSSIVYLKSGAPWEVHQKHVEKFLIAAGTCDIVCDDGKIFHLKAGDYCAITPKIGHFVNVTSEEHCIIILQREAC